MSSSLGISYGFFNREGLFKNRGNAKFVPLGKAKSKLVSRKKGSGCSCKKKRVVKRRGRGMAQDRMSSYLL